MGEILGAALARPVSGTAAARIDALTAKALAHRVQADELLEHMADLLADKPPVAPEE